jgi:hypothetical protein
MLNPWILLAAFLALAGTYLVGEIDGRHNERTVWTARIEKERAAAAEAARVEERRQQEAVNDALRKQSQTLAGINSGLRRDLDGLRNRPERPADVPDTPRPACAGATGAELSRPDAGFLAGEAARADECRAGLDACYTVIDAMNKKGPAP